MKFSFLRCFPAKCSFVFVLGIKKKRHALFLTKKTQKLEKITPKKWDLLSFPFSEGIILRWSSLVTGIRKMRESGLRGASQKTLKGTQQKHKKQKKKQKNSTYTPEY